jgi:endonuclease G
MKMKRLFLLVFLFILTIYIPTQGAESPKENEAGEEQELIDINLQWGYLGEKGLLLKKGYFTINYSEKWKIPYWVAYHISADRLQIKVHRTNDFRADIELPKGSRAEPYDYAKKYGFAKGHHVTPEAFRYDKEAVSKTFLLSTISPQTYQLNRYVWSPLEKEILSTVAKMEEAWVFSGNLFLNQDNEKTEPSKFIGPNDIAVPTHFFKVILFRDKGSNYFMEAYLIPNQKKFSFNYTDHLETVKELEKITKYEFFPKLDLDAKTIERLKSSLPSKIKK